MATDHWMMLSVTFPRGSANTAIPFLEEKLARWNTTGCVESDDGERMEYSIYFEPASFPSGAAAKLLAEAADRRIDSVEATGPIPIPRENWHDNWREFFKPVQVSPALTIRPSWEKETHQIAPDVTDIFIEPGMAFGTGTHATTKLCLIFAERYVLNNDLVLDIGTGSSILAIASVLLGARFAIGFDTDIDIAENAALNLRLNGIGPERAAVFVGSLDAVRPVPFDLIFCNMLSHQFLPILPRLRARCGPGARVLLSGFLTTEKAEIHAAVAAAGFTVIDSETVDEWTAFALTPEKDSSV